MAKNTKLELYLEDSYQDRYLVEVKNKDGEWEVLPEFPFPMSKGLTVAVYFNTWCKSAPICNQPIIREVFPSSLNNYYSQREKGGSILWTLCSGPDDEEFNAQNTDRIRRTYLKAEDGYMIKLSDAGEDFYVVGTEGDSYEFPAGGGWENGETYMIVKNWRDEDFERFVNRVSNPIQVAVGDKTLTLTEENVRIVKYSVGIDLK